LRFGHQRRIVVANEVSQGVPTRPKKDHEMLPANLSVLLQTLNASGDALGPFARALLKELAAMDQDKTLSARFSDPHYAAAAGPTPPADICLLCGKKK
jgi:hypothetical protein